MPDIKLEIRELFLKTTRIEMTGDNFYFLHEMNQLLETSLRRISAALRYINI